MSGKASKAAKTKAGRSKMARKAARTRKKRS